MKRHLTTTLIALSLLLGLLSWRTFTSRAASGHTGAGQQVGEPFRVVAWGNNAYGQTTIPTAAQSGVTAIAAGVYYSLALKSDGSLVAWGDNGQGQTNIPTAAQSGVTAIAAGGFHSLALKSDGSLVAWGWNNVGQTNIPTAAQSGVTAIAAGAYYSLALKSDGSVVAWGDNFNGQTNIPTAAQSGVSAIAAGGFHSLALKSDGTVAAWGKNDVGQTIVPNGLSGVIAIAAGGNHSLALKSDGSVVAWGWNNVGQTDVPNGLSGITAIAAGFNHSLALKSDGTVVVWGSNDAGQTNVPNGLSGVTAIAAGFNHSLALSNNTAPTLTIAAVSRTAGAAASSATIAIVNDAEDAENTLSVTATPLTGSGVTVTGISVNSSGTVTANVAASCTATTSTFTLQVTDSGSLSQTATLTITVNANELPTLSYPSNPGTSFGIGITVNPLTGPSDDLGVTSVVVQNITPSNPGGISVNSSGVVTVANTVPAGTYTVTIRANAACSNKDASFTLGIAKITPVITWSNPANITCNTPLSTTQLNATTTVPGSFVYTPSVGTVLGLGSGQMLSVLFNPTDTTNYNSASKSVTINVVDTTAPTLTLKPNLTFWPPDHKYRTVTMAQMVQSVSDGCSNTLGIGNVVIEKVTSDEPDDVAGDNDGITTNDILIAADCKSVQLRAERDETRNGRVYVITLRVKDASGNTTHRDFRVSVPISQNGVAAVQDATAQTRTSVCP